jgi:hypothetical protein
MKKLLALLLLFGIVGCEQEPTQLEKCVAANLNFKELTLDMIYVNDYDEIDLLPKSILDLNLIFNSKLEEEYKTAVKELAMKNFPATKQNSDYLGFCEFDLDNSCDLDKEINQYNKVWSKPNQIAAPTFVNPFNSDTDIRFFLSYYVRSQSMVNIQKEFPNEPSTFWLDVELLENDYLIKSLDYNIEVNNIPKLIEDFNDDAIKSYQLNETGICNAQGIY